MPTPRPSARLLILNPEGEVLLFLFEFSAPGQDRRRFWATPGGALGASETFEAAARRELLEETGLDMDPGGEVAQRTVCFDGPDGEALEADERYFLVRAPHTVVDWSGLEPEEATHIKAHKWWALDDIQSTSETIYPEQIVDFVHSALGK